MVRLVVLEIYIAPVPDAVRPPTGEKEHMAYGTELPEIRRRLEACFQPRQGTTLDLAWLGRGFLLPASF